MIALKIPLKVVFEVLANFGIQITADGHREDDVLRQQLAILDAAWADDEATADGDESPAQMRVSKLGVVEVSRDA